MVKVMWTGPTDLKTKRCPSGNIYDFVQGHPLDCKPGDIEHFERLGDFEVLRTTKEKKAMVKAAQKATAKETVKRMPVPKRQKRKGKKNRRL